MISIVSPVFTDVLLGRQEKSGFLIICPFRPGPSNSVINARNSFSLRMVDGTKKDFHSLRSKHRMCKSERRKQKVVLFFCAL
jgi:hypothetical protein